MEYEYSHVSLTQWVAYDRLLEIYIVLYWGVSEEWLDTSHMQNQFENIDTVYRLPFD